MRRVYLKEEPLNTCAGQIVVSMVELDFLFHLTGIKDPQEAIEHFAVICASFFKEPQDVLKAINISPMGGNVLFVYDENAPLDEEPTYKRFIYEVTVKNG